MTQIEEKIKEKLLDWFEIIEIDETSETIGRRVFEGIRTIF